jgi:hypothetical protein
MHAVWMRLLLCAVVLAAVGCGDDAMEGPQGAWTLPEGSGGLALTLDGDRYVALDMAAAGTHTNVRMDRGTFVVTGAQIVFSPEEWTCEGAAEPYTLGYTLDGDRLTLSVPGGEMRFTRAAGPAEPAAPVYGCFDAANRFTPAASR